jgi:hypothetical protein
LDVIAKSTTDGRQWLKPRRGRNQGALKTAHYFEESAKKYSPMMRSVAGRMIFTFFASLAGFFAGAIVQCNMKTHVQWVRNGNPADDEFAQVFFAEVAFT